VAAVIGAHAIASLLTALSLAGGHPGAPEAATAAAQPAAREATATASAAARPLAGKVVGIDPGHNGGNFSDPSFINHSVWNGRESEACDTTGTETDGGYTEALFNFNVASYLRAILIREGAKVVMTRRTNDGVGPCIDRRAQILDKARADVAIDIHADGGPPGGRGVAILTPVPDGPNDHVIASSKRFGRILLNRYTKVTGIPISNYDGSGGFAPRDNLAGLNLTTVPKVLIECVNMRNATDASRLVKPAFQRLAAQSMADAITVFLRSR
jgi:N-acetylmuramoyl-L-alanine amidase